jgi:excisionase family DNA binding protein
MHFPPTPRVEKSMTLSEVSSRFGVSATTLVRWGAEGRVRTIRSMSGKRRFDADEIERALANAR